jgi:catechol 2,3-dioxygenase-like lactoylglutathione lyase family enzyme
MLSGLNHLTLGCSDLGRSIDFFHRLLGFRLAARWDGGAYLALGDLWLCLSLDPNTAACRRADYTHYAFTLTEQDFPAFRATLRAEGILEWKTNTSEGDSFYFLDPDGHQLEAHVGNLASRLAHCRAAPYPGMQFFD